MFPGTIGGNLSNTIMYSPGGGAGSLAPMTPMPSMMPAHMSTPLPFAAPLHQSTIGPIPGTMQDIAYSGKHNGIYIYLARILR